MTPPLRYAPEIESPAPDEDAAIEGIVAQMTRQSEKVMARDNHAVRASHAKSTALAVGTLEVAPNLPVELRQGLFARQKRFAVAVRFAQGPGESLADRVGTHRGMAMKVFGVEGEKLPGHVENTQDFVLASGSTFPSGTAQGFLADEKQLVAGVDLPEGVKAFVSSAARNLNRALGAVGTQSAKADFFGHPDIHPLAEPYYSQAPVRFGDFVAKLAAFPVSPGQRMLLGETVDTARDPDAFRHATERFMRDNDTVFSLRAQLWLDPDRQPIEDASVEWPEDLSPFRDVATIRLPRQETGSAARRRYFDEVMAFRPAHSLVAHRPLGSVMRARLRVYEALSAFRHRENGVPPEEPASPERIPA